jgi:hypothetical protein
MVPPPVLAGASRSDTSRLGSSRPGGRRSAARRRGATTLAVLLVLAGGIVQTGAAAPARADQPPPLTGSLAVQLPRIACADVARLDLSGIPGFPVAISSAEMATAQPGGYEVCDVRGTIAPQIQFRSSCRRRPTGSATCRPAAVGCAARWPSTPSRPGGAPRSPRATS